MPLGRILRVALGVLSVASLLLGASSDAQQADRLGLPGWAWCLIAYLVLALLAGLVIHDQHSELRKLRSSRPVFDLDLQLELHRLPYRAVTDRTPNEHQWAIRSVLTNNGTPAQFRLVLDHFDHDPSLHWRLGEFEILGLGDRKKVLLARSRIYPSRTPQLVGHSWLAGSYDFYLGIPDALGAFLQVPGVQVQDDGDPDPASLIADSTRLNFVLRVDQIGNADGAGWWRISLGFMIDSTEGYRPRIEEITRLDKQPSRDSSVGQP